MVLSLRPWFFTCLILVCVLVPYKCSKEKCNISLAALFIKGKQQ